MQPLRQSLSIFSGETTCYFRKRSHFAGPVVSRTRIHRPYTSIRREKETPSVIVYQWPRAVTPPDNKNGRSVSTSSASSSSNASFPWRCIRMHLFPTAFKSARIDHVDMTPPIITTYRTTFPIFNVISLRKFYRSELCIKLKKRHDSFHVLPKLVSQTTLHHRSLEAAIYLEILMEEDLLAID